MQSRRVEIGGFVRAIEEFRAQFIVAQWRLCMAAREADLAGVEQAPIAGADLHAVGERERRVCEQRAQQPLELRACDAVIRHHGLHVPLLADGPLGRVLAAATARGVCFVALGDDPERLAADLAREFPGAELVADTAALADVLGSVVAYLEGRLPRSIFNRKGLNIK